MANIYVYSGAGGAGTGADWTNAFTTMTAAIAAAVAGDVFLLAHDHNQTQASLLTMTFPGTPANPNRVYSVNRAVPTPGGGDLLAGAKIATTGNNAMAVHGSIEVFGVRLTVADGANAPSLTLCGTANHRQVWRNCIIDFTQSTGAQTCFIGVNTSETPTEVLWTDNCQFLTGIATQVITCRETRFAWENSTSPVTAGANGSRHIIGGTTTETGSHITIRNLDLSALTSASGIVLQRAAADQITVENCRLPAGAADIYHATTPDTVTQVGFRLDILRSERLSGINYGQRRYAYGGSLKSDALVTRAGGASDGTTAFSWKIATGAESSWSLPFESLNFGAMNNVVGSALTVTVEGIANTAALPQNDELWLEVSGLTNATYPLGSMARSARANGLTTPANYATSTASWGATAPARANSTAYALGAPIAVASNSGRVFFCTTAGTTSGTEPAGYATAIDGGSVTDGSAVFRAGWRFKMAATLTPAMAGPLMARIQAAEPSQTWYIDPAFTVA